MMAQSAKYFLQSIALPIFILCLCLAASKNQVLCKPVAIEQESGIARSPPAALVDSKDAAKSAVPFSPIPIGRDDDEEESTVDGPGAAGILAGLSGIFANIVKGDLGKLVESTFNFVPKEYHNNVKTVYNGLLGKPPPQTSTEASESSGSQTDSKVKPITPEPAFIETAEKDAST